jgi:hypothetical protein
MARMPSPTRERRALPKLSSAAAQKTRVSTLLPNTSEIVLDKFVVLDKGKRASAAI